jgi:hypothetical protein
MRVPAPPYGFVLRSSSGAPLIEAHVDPTAVRRLRHAWRVRVHGAALAICALTLVLLALRSREAQRRERDGKRFLALTGAVALLLVGARALAALAIPPDWLISSNGSRLQPWLLRSPADALLNALLVLALVSLSGWVIERCRLSRRAAGPPGGAARQAFW